MKIVAIPDLHGGTTAIPLFGQPLAAADIVLLPGDLTNGSVQAAKDIIGAVRQHNKNILAVPGNMDRVPVSEYLFDEGVNIHGTSREIDGVHFIGVGGATPFYGQFVFEEPELADLLKQAAANTSAPQVLVCHNPPYNTTTDITRGKHVGSHSVRAFIEAEQPLVCFSGHIHESVGVDAIGATKVINPGHPLRGGKYAYAEIVDGVLTVCEVRAR